MEILRTIIFLLFSFAVISLIWARFNFFEVKTKASKKVSYINDPTVLVMLCVTYWSLLNKTIGFTEGVVSVIIYFLGVSLFWWSLLTAKKLNFANSPREGELITSGPYRFVRHPFYLSYLMVWFGCLIFIQSWVIVIGFSVLAAIYVFSAVNEERMIMSGLRGADYKEYRSRVSMFIPFFV